MNIHKLISFIFLFTAAVTAQNNINISVTAGSGTISSDSPYFTGFTSSLSVGADKLYDVITPRLTIYYSGDFNSLLPASDRSHYPHIIGAAVKGVYSVKLQGNFYYEQSVGLLAAEDRVFVSSSGWGIGFIISVLGGADLRGSSDSGFRIGLGGEYGLTVYNRYIRYLGLYFQAQYVISY